MGGGGKGDGQKPKEIIKEGLSEYFIYTIEGTETIKTLEQRCGRGGQRFSQIEYRYRPQEYYEQMVRLYLLKNEWPASSATPLPDGVVRVFRDNGRDGLLTDAAGTK